MKRLIPLLLILFANLANATTYYVRTDGNDANTGLANTAEGAWKTCSKVNAATAFLEAGDVVHFGTGTFGAAQNDTTLMIPASGAAGNPIIYEGEGWDKTTITAGVPVTGWVSQGGNIYGHAKADTDSVYGMWFVGVAGARRYTYAELDVEKEWYSTPDSLYVYLAAATDTANVIKSKDWVIRGDGKSYITIKNMKVAYGTGINATNSASSNIYISGTANDVTIQNVWLEYGRTSNIYLTIPKVTIKSCVLKNTVYNLYLGGAADSSTIYNNTIIDGSSRGITMLTGCLGVTIKNNIISQTTGVLISCIDSIISNNNLFYKPSYTNSWLWNGVNISTLSAWQDSTGQEQNSLTGDPLFVGATDYRLQLRSPAINKGIDVGLTEDINGVPLRYGKPDMGAFETRLSQKWMKLRKGYR